MRKKQYICRLFNVRMYKKQELELEKIAKN